MSLAISPLAQTLINRYQDGFPLTPRPFATIAAQLRVAENEVLAAMAELQAAGVLSRLGGVVKSGCIGASTLAAMTVPPQRLEQVAALVSARPEVNHNYEREDDRNLWFVVVAPHEAALQSTLRDLERQSGCTVDDLRLTKAHHIDLGFAL